MVGIGGMSYHHIKGFLASPDAEIAALVDIVPEQLEKLADLVKSGVLTQAEFDAKKQQLLDKM